MNGLMKKEIQTQKKKKLTNVHRSQVSFVDSILDQLMHLPLHTECETFFFHLPLQSTLDHFQFPLPIALTIPPRIRDFVSPLSLLLQFPFHERIMDESVQNTQEEIPIVPQHSESDFTAPPEKTFHTTDTETIHDVRCETERDILWFLQFPSCPQGNEVTER